MNFKTKNLKIFIIIILLIIIVGPIFHYIYNNSNFKEGMSPQDLKKLQQAQNDSLDKAIGATEKVHQKMRQTILDDNSLSQIEKLQKLQKISMASTVNKEKQLNFNFNKLLDLKVQGDELADIQAEQINLDNQIKDLQQKHSENTMNKGTELAKQFFGTAAYGVAGAKVVTNGMNNHLDSMTKSNPLAEDDGEPGSHGDPSKKKCLNKKECQTPPFYKGNYILTGNALFGSCPCPIDEPDAFGAHWSCCAVPFAD